MRACCWNSTAWRKPIAQALGSWPSINGYCACVCSVPIQYKLCPLFVPFTLVPMQYKLCQCLFLSHSFPYNKNSAPVVPFTLVPIQYNTNSAPVCSFHTRSHTIQTQPLFVHFANTIQIQYKFNTHTMQYNTNSAPVCSFRNCSHTTECNTNSSLVCSFHTRSHTVQPLPVFVLLTLVPIQCKLCQCLFLSHSFPYNTNSVSVFFFLFFSSH